jgi:TonB-linked SusC/RagA family outer membrane protein
VNVLKGASASALYGSAASNGVIIVTTRKGTKGRPVIRLSSTATVEEISFMPKLQNRFGPDGGENSFAYPGTIQFPENPFLWYVPYENQNYGPEFNGQPVTVGGPVRIYSPDGTTFTDSTLKGIYSAKPNSKKDFFDKGLTLQQDLSYSAGDEKSRFYMSFQDVDVKGIIPKDIAHRNTFRVNGSRETGKFRADYNLGYTVSKANTTPGSGVPFRWGTSDYTGGYAGGGSYFQNRPVYWTVINTGANIDLRAYKDWQNNPFANPDGYYNAYYGNPWWQIDETRLDERNNDFLGSASLSFRPVNWINILYRFSLAHNDYQNKYTQAGWTFADWAKADPLGAGNIPSSVQKLNPSEGDGFSTNQRVISDLLISLQRNFFTDLDAKLILGNQVQSNYFRAGSISASALVIPDFYNISNRIGEAAVGETKIASRTYGVFGDLTLGWKEFLFVHTSVRNDWTSILSKDNRSYLYPAVDASFVFSELLKDKLPSWFNYGKIRGAYSKTAQVSIGPYSLANIFVNGPGFPYSSAAGFTVGNSYANSDIKPEFTKEKEVGLELGFWHSRINVSAAYYDAKTNNQTIPITISSTTGFTQAFVNSGVMSNKGIEFDAKITPLLKLGDFHWDIGGNFSYNKNNVESIGFGLPEVFVGGSSFAVVGNPYPVIKTNDWKRDDQNHIIVSKTNGLPSIDPTQKYFGTTNPPYRVGLTTTLSYKGFTLNVLADGRFGAVIFNSIGSSLDFTGVSWYSAQSGRQAFVLPNSVVDDGTGKYVTNTNYSVNEGNNGFWASTWNAVGANYVTSADFWKLREVSLIYDLPKKVFTKVNAIKSVSVGFVGRNLYTWKAKQNVWTDPEFSNTNGNGIGTTDINQTPPTRFYGGNITVTF